MSVAGVDQEANWYGNPDSTIHLHITPDRVISEVANSKNVSFTTDENRFARLMVESHGGIKVERGLASMNGPIELTYRLLCMWTNT